MNRLWPLLLLLLACDGESNDASGNAPTNPEGAPAATVPGDVALRQLTRAEFEVSLAYAIGSAQASETVPDQFLEGMARVGARSTQMTGPAVESFSQAVETALEQTFAVPTDRAKLVGCTPGEGDCLVRFVRRLGQRAWRRPLNADEIKRYVMLGESCRAANDAWAPARCVAAGLLHSPHFLYRVELPTDGVFRGYAMASRMAYLLWGGPPDTALLQMAHDGQLDTADGVREVAVEMLQSPRARHGLRALVSEWFRLDRLQRLERDVLANSLEEVQFALGRTGELQNWLQWFRFAAGEELLKTIEHHVFDLDRDYLELLTTENTFVDPHLEQFYSLSEDEGEGEPAPIGAPIEGPRRLTIEGEPDANGFRRARHTADSPRRGIMGSMALLSQLGKQNETSPTRRGLYLMERILCLEIGEPPDDIDVCPRPEGVSRRASMEQHHMCAASCAGCHAQMDPIGFALDGFDTLGRSRRTDDWGNRLDTQVEWTVRSKDGVKTLQFDGLRGMAEAFKALPEASRCVVQQVYRAGTGHAAEDPAELAALTAAFEGNGRKLKGFLAEFVASDAFRRIGHGGTPSLQVQVEALFDEACSACHIVQALGNLSLTPEGLFERLTVPRVGGDPYITPGDPSKSHLWTRVEAGLMPPGKPLSSAQQTLLRTWIEELSP